MVWRSLHESRAHPSSDGHGFRGNTDLNVSLDAPQQLTIWTPAAALGPFVFYRLSKGLWTSIIFLGEGLYIPWPNR